jgi:hypothetical protein
MEDDAPGVPMEMAPTSGKKARDPLDGYDSDIPMESGNGRSQQASILDDDPLSGLDFGDSSAFGSANSDDDDMRSPNRNSALDSQEIDDLLASGPQPIADLFGRDPDEDDYEEDGGKGKGGLIALLLILLMAGLGAGAWFGRSTVVSMIPALEPLYAMVGIEVDVSSAGLVFQDVTLDRQSVSGVDVLVVRGRATGASGRDDSDHGAAELVKVRHAAADAGDAPSADGAFTWFRSVVRAMHGKWRSALFAAEPDPRLLARAVVRLFHRRRAFCHGVVEHHSTSRGSIVGARPS